MLRFRYRNREDPLDYRIPPERLQYSVYLIQYRNLVIPYYLDYRNPTVYLKRYRNQVIPYPVDYRNPTVYLIEQGVRGGAVHVAVSGALAEIDQFAIRDFEISQFAMLDYGILHFTD